MFLDNLKIHYILLIIPTLFFDMMFLEEQLALLISTIYHLSPKYAAVEMPDIYIGCHGFSKN